MKRFFTSLLCTAALLSQAGVAVSADVSALTVSRLGDTEMSCGDLSKEALLMRQIINTTEEIKEDSAMTNKGISAAGAVGSFLIGSVTGGVGIAAAGFLLKEANGEKADDAEETQDIAEQRRSLMMGIYNAKGCEGPLEHVLLSPEEEIVTIASIDTVPDDEEHRQPDYNE